MASRSVSTTYITQVPQTQQPTNVAPSAVSGATVTTTYYSIDNPQIQ